MREDKLNQFYKVYRRNRIPDTFDVKNLYIADTYASSSALDYNGIIEELYKLGFHVEVAQNYCDCIAEITSGNYHQVWVICSKGQEAKPTNVDVCNSIKKRSGEIRGESTDFSHAYQFVESVEEFRKKGGAVSFWADQDFTFELDYYLEHLEVYDCDKVDGNPTKIPCNLRFDGSCSPKNDVLQRATPNSFKEMTFDSEEIKEYPYYDYQFYGYNVLGLYAGQTIAGVKVPGCHNYQEICERIKPFKPFSLGTDKELVTGCYYVSPKNSNEGDIIIDGASSRIFRALNPEGAKRLARNMAVGLVNKARRVAEQGDYTDAEPVPAFKEPNIPIQIPIVQNKLVKPVDLTFIFDATKSAEKIKSLINYQIESAMKWLQKFQGDVRVAVIGFRNEAAAYCLNKDIEINRTDVIDFTPISKADKILDEINYNFSYEGGIGDGPKDWNSAFEAYLNLNFRKDSTKITFFIPGDGTHHPDFHKKPSNDSTVDFDNYKFDGEKMTQQQRLDDHIRRLVKQEAYWVLCGFNSNAIDPLKTLLKNMNNTKVSFITLKECSSTPNLDPLINISDEKLERIYENILIKTSSLPTMFDI
ncbi:hypothetical protein TVAG_079500 [Trichomonas vaginalis G3]|uniref:VWFA domain-containing protein n=1 Tax=Trichomonas vaginalis (strain ATCC PRA-98 / G3) TaxID=412133 RepID=A2EF82_TRIV3|nr:nuclear chaperone required for maturation and nuclear export of pre-60s ribosome subunits [Trichomonas vaginalis G3]EAY08692.1 hypothetical protein TVAG_079500 [Trichomonas vaginalis G3]KAI5492819.1 nuclear chaperone required for maturation and nuclear export of pre-60s ribosome subunits [Trichomonas vaginalis G3]|eukprot:XP_001320915.1 hypothetical protein [Trichomonas vaginalis G3]